MKFFKTKEEKRILLEKELEDLNLKYKKYLNSFCMIDTYVFIFKGFEINNNEITICYQDKDTPLNMYNLYPYFWWRQKYNTNVDVARKNWVYHKDILERLGIKTILK